MSECKIWMTMIDLANIKQLKISNVFIINMTVALGWSEMIYLHIYPSIQVSIKRFTSCVCCGYYLLFSHENKVIVYKERADLCKKGPSYWVLDKMENFHFHSLKATMKCT